MTTESLMIHAIRRGLLISDFNELSVGMILDYISKYDQIYIGLDNENVQKATQNEFNAF